MTRARLIGLVALVALVGMALLGGEYNIRDWWVLKRELAAERATLARLEREIDSLTALARELETSPAAQERAAREEFGMIRNGETLYRLVPAK